MKKKKNEQVAKKYEKEYNEPFVIFQIEENTVGIRQRKGQFVRSEMVSPMEGPYTKDVEVFDEQDIHEDIDEAYDVFRVVPKRTAQDEIEKHGKIYHEFPDVSEELKTQNDYSPRETNEPVEEDKFGFNLCVTHYGKEEERKEKIFDEMIQEHRKELYKEEEQAEEEIPDTKGALTKEDMRFFENEIETKIESSNPEEKRTIITYGSRDIVEDDYGDYDSLKRNQQREQERVEERGDEQIVFEAPVPDTEVKYYDDMSEILDEKPRTEVKTPVAHVEAREEPKREEKVIYVDRYVDYKYPPYSLLDPVPAEVKTIPEWAEERKDIIDTTLREFGVDGYVENFTVGPSITRYEIKLGEGVMVKKILTIQDNLQMNLACKSLRIEAPIPGKSNVGIEVSNVKNRTVQFGEIVDIDAFKNTTNPLTVALGLNIDGKPIYSRIPKMPHALVAGATGSGKSVCMNTILISLLLKNSPNQLKLILVDPKKVELVAYEDLPHLITPVITDPKLANEALQWACEEMERRYKEFSVFRCKDIEVYNYKVKEFNPDGQTLPYLVVVVDELADLMITCGGDVEDSIKRITQMGRAAGIHLIVATQRPTTDIVNGTIKANIPARIAFRVNQEVDSRTILDQSGAEKLLGYGDMLLKEADVPQRVQGAYISELEISKITDYIRDNYKPDYLFTHEELQEKTKASYGIDSTMNIDEGLLYDVALDCITKGSCSINKVQQAFRVNFNKAQAIVNALAERGVVSESKGTTGREILMTIDEVETLFSK